MENENFLLNPELESFADFQAWSQLAGIALAFTGAPELIGLFNTNLAAVTVGEYLQRVALAQASLETLNLAVLGPQIPFLQQQFEAAIAGVPIPVGSEIATILNFFTQFFNELAQNNFTTIETVLDTILDTLDGVDGSVMFSEAFEPLEGIVTTFTILSLVLVTLPPSLLVGWASGDPHLQTLDGVGYDFQAVGEYTLLQQVGGDFELQARLIQAGANASQIAAIATEVDGTAVQIDGTDAVPLTIDGEAVDLAEGEGAEVGNGVVYFIDGEYRIVYPGADGVVNNGDSQVLVRVVDGRVDVDVRLNNELLGNLEGLLGNGDGNPDNDVALADGTPLARPFAFADIYGQYRDDWRVTETESLFTYDAGESNAGFYNAGFPAAEVSLDTLDPSVRQQAEAAAEAAGLVPGTPAFENAVLDFAITGEDSFFESAANVPVVRVGTDADEVLTGGAGDDNLNGAGGNDRVDGGDGADNLNGGPGDDGVLGGAGGDVMNGGDGDDNMAAGAGNDIVRGGDGNDFMGGGEGSDSMLGQAGNDTLGGGFGDDTVNGGDGDDVVASGAGDDEVIGGNGDDVMGASFGNDSVSGGAGNDDLGGGTGQDLIDAGIGNDSVGGGEGNDTVVGGEGDDFLAGGGRDDMVSGGAGADTINGGDGSDTMTGDAGADVFTWNESDTGVTDFILGFEDGIDLIRLAGVENAPGTGIEGRVDALSIMDATVNGTAGASLTYGDQTILVEGVAAAGLTADDFIFT